MSVKKLSDFEKYKEMKMLVKFLKKEYLQDLLDGNLYMNKLGFFIDLEKEEQNKGQGDKYEAAFVTKFQNGKLMLSGTDKVIGTIKTGDVIERYENVTKAPVFCCTILTGENLEVISETDDVLTVKPMFNEEQKSKLLSDFGDKAVVLTNDFIQKVGSKLVEQNMNMTFGQIEYVDNSVVDTARKKSFDEGSLEMFFWKDEYFQYQQEFRLVVLGKFIENHFILNIGDISEKSKVMNTVDFFESSVFEFEK